MRKLWAVHETAFAFGLVFCICTWWVRSIFCSQDALNRSVIYNIMDDHICARLLRDHNCAGSHYIRTELIWTLEMMHCTVITTMYSGSDPTGRVNVYPLIPTLNSRLLLRYHLRPFTWFVRPLRPVGTSNRPTHYSRYETTITHTHQSSIPNRYIHSTISLLSSFIYWNHPPLQSVMC